MPVRKAARNEALRGGMSMSRHSVVRAAAAALLLLSPWIGDAMAQRAKSCQAEIAKGCAQIQPGRSRVSQCMRQGLDTASLDCRAHARAVTLQLKETRQPCEDDLLLLCEGADLTEAGIAGCLARNRAALA